MSAERNDYYERLDRQALRAEMFAAFGIRVRPSFRDWLFSVAPLSLWDPFPAVGALMGLAIFGILRALWAS